MKVKQRFPWIPVSAAAAVLVVGVVAWLQIPTVIPAAKTGASMPTLGFSRPDTDAKSTVLAEQLAAYDPTPLFLPTAMNSGQKTVAFGEQASVNGPFLALAPRLVFNPEKADIVFPPIVTVPSSAVQGVTLANRREVPLVMGRTDAAAGQLASRVGYLEAVRSGDNRVVLSMALPETAKRPESDWQPMELLGAVSSAGLVGDLAVTVSSGSDAVDDYFTERLVRMVRVGERLSPGFYTFRIGP